MERICYLPPHVLEENPFQPRSLIEENKLEELILSVREPGILHPLLVRQKEDGSWQIISGHGRVLAAKKAGLVNIAALVQRLL